MPRYWFISDDETSLLQVQKNAFMLNWRKRGTDYPRFSAGLKPDFDEYFSKFSRFVSTYTGTSELKIDLCQLTYINVIERCEFWSGPRDTHRVIPSFTTPDPGVAFENQTAFNCTYIFDVSSDLWLVVAVRNVVLSQESDEPNPLLIFEIRAEGHLGQASKAETDRWFDRAHVAINECFLGITDPKIQRQYWKPEGDKQ